MCVLFVEDDDLIRDATCDILRSRGHAVLVARDGAEAIGLIDNPPRRLSVLVTDFQMPGDHHGGDVVKHMRACHPHVHVFLATGSPELLDRICQGELDCTVIPKPYSAATMLGHIEHLIEN